MKKTLQMIFLGLAMISNINAQINTELIGHLDVNPGSHKSDIWGYVDSTGREYAIIDGFNGIYFVDLIDPANPTVADFIAGPSSIWRDIKVHENYVYAVTDGVSGAGLQIVDLSGLPASVSLVKTVDQYFTTAHNIFIDDGFAYVIGTSGGGGMHVLDLADPVNPVQTAYYIGSGFIHDVFVWNDTVVACAADSYDLVDVTDKENPFKISESAPIPGIYAHSGWMTENKRYFYATDELNVTDIIVYDLQDRTTWEIVIPSWQLPNNTRVHNLFIKGNYAHISYYEAGYVILDISDPESPFLIGQYDTFPSNGGDFVGAWGCYPYLPSGLTLISDTQTGLYVFKFTPGDVPPTITNNFTDDFVLNTDPVTLSAKIIDNQQVTEVKLYYRVVSDSTTGDWVMLNGENPVNNVYEFEVPGQPHLTTTEYYYAAQDDSNNIVTLPLGGSGSNPIGNTPPPMFFSYQVIIAGTPVAKSFLPDFTDTTIVRFERIEFSADVIDTSGLPITIRWYKNELLRKIGTDFLFTSGFSQPPTTDTVTAVATNGFKSIQRVWYINIEPVTSVDDENIIVDYSLKQNFPNPFNPSTTISYSLPAGQYVSLIVYNMLGQKAATLVDEFKNVGNYKITFSADNLSTGVYIAHLKIGDFSKSIKMTLLK